MDKSVESLRMIKLEMPYKLCFTGGKNLLKNDDTVRSFTNHISVKSLYSRNELYHHFSVC